MKPSKQKNSEVNKKKNGKEKIAAANKIKSYFQPSAKIIAENVDNGTESVYVKALKKRLQGARLEEVDEPDITNYEGNAMEDRSSEHCYAKLDEGAIGNIANVDRSTKLQIDLQTYRGVPTDCSPDCTLADCIRKAVECREWERKYKEMKKTYLGLTVEFSEEHIKYKSLVRATTAAGLSSESDGAPVSDDGIFTENEIKALQRIPFDKPKDSTFIMECLEYAYKQRPTDLCRRTLHGTNEKVEFNEKGEEVKRKPGKDPITPDKTARIKQLFITRISDCKLSAAEHAERIHDAYVNRLFASGIKNISKKYPEQQ